MGILSLNGTTWGGIAVGSAALVLAGVVYYRSTISPSKKQATVKKLKPGVTGKSKKSVKDSTSGAIKENNHLELDKVEQAMDYKTQGNNSFRESKFENAITYYTKSIEVCPKEHSSDLAVFYQNRAASYEKLEQWRAVIEDCSTALTLNPNYTKALHRRANAYEKLEEYKKCLRDLTATCFQERFSSETTLIKMEHILKKAGQADAEEIYKNRETIMPSAIVIKSVFNSFMEDPCRTTPISNGQADIPVTGYVLARKALEEERYEDVISACTQEIEVDSKDNPKSLYATLAQLLRGTLYLIKGDEKAAEEDFDAVIANAPESNIRAFGYARRGLVKLHRDKPDDCMQDINQALKLDPSSADIHALYGQVLLISNGFQEASEQFSKAVALNNKHVMAQVQNCLCRYRLCSETSAVADILNDFFKTVEAFPDYIDGYAILAQVLCDLNRFDDAELWLNKAFKIEPNSATLLAHKAILKLQKDTDITGAIDLLEKAIKQDEKCELAYETLGTIEVHRTNLNLAVEYFNKALKYAKNYDTVVHRCSLRNAAQAQIEAAKITNIEPNYMSQLAI